MRLLLYFSFTLHFFIVIPCFSFQQTKRESSYPYLSGDTFRAFCDHIIDETKISFKTDNVAQGDIIFVKSDMLELFFTSIHPRITKSYILLTHNSSYSVPRKYAYWLDDPKIIAWFGQNIDRQHPKLFALPLGIENARWLGGSITSFKNIIQKLPLVKDKLLYLNISINTNPKKRKPIVDYFKRTSFCYNGKKKGHKEFLQDLATSFFVVSPEGRSIDCHRTWEALYCGSIPLVKSSSINELFEDLPVLIIDDWQKITKEYLENIYKQMCKKTYNMEKLYADYWFKRIKKLQDSYR